MLAFDPPQASHALLRYGTYSVSPTLSEAFDFSASQLFHTSNPFFSLCSDLIEDIQSLPGLLSPKPKDPAIPLDNGIEDDDDDDDDFEITPPYANTQEHTDDKTMTSKEPQGFKNQTYKARAFKKHILDHKDKGYSSNLGKKARKVKGPTISHRI
ncbi:hypothetical protein BG000_006472 [Podila horticola]|nr:hypothetical protein BG000_006472 [Podila horticola]